MFEGMMNLIPALVSSKSGAIIQPWANRLSAGNLWYGEQVNAAFTRPSSNKLLCPKFISKIANHLTSSLLSFSFFNKLNTAADRLMAQLTIESA